MNSDEFKTFEALSAKEEMLANKAVIPISNK